MTVNVGVVQYSDDYASLISIPSILDPFLVNRTLYSRVPYITYPLLCESLPESLLDCRPPCYSCCLDPKLTMFTTCNSLGPKRVQLFYLQGSADFLAFDSYTAGSTCQ